MNGTDTSAALLPPVPPAPVPPAAKPPTVNVAVNSHPSHWPDILSNVLYWVLKLAPVGAAVATQFTPADVTNEINTGVGLANEIAPIVIQIDGLAHQTPPAPVPTQAAPAQQ